MTYVVYPDDGNTRVEVDAAIVVDILCAFGLDVHMDNNGVVRRNEPLSLSTESSQTWSTEMVDTVNIVALAHHLLGLPDEKFRETGLMLAQRPDTWREFDAARRLGAGTAELQRILLGGLFNEVPK